MRATAEEDAARVIVIGGAPLGGKTTVARPIGRRVRMPATSADHLGRRHGR